MNENIQISCLFSILCTLLPISYTYTVIPLKNTVTATMNVRVNPDGLAINPNSHYAYVVNNNNYGIPNQNSVTVLNLRKNTVNQTIHDSSFNEPFRITISPDGKLAYVVNSNYTTLSIIDTHLNEVIGIIDGFDGPSGIVITPDGKFAYVNNYGGPSCVGSGNGTTVSVVNLETNTMIEEITIGQAPAALTISSKGKFVYSINYVDGLPDIGSLSIILTKTNTVINTVTGFFGPFGTAVTPTENMPMSLILVAIIFRQLAPL